MVSIQGDSKNHQQSKILDVVKIITFSLAEDKFYGCDHLLSLLLHMYLKLVNALSQSKWIMYQLQEGSGESRIAEMFYNKPYLCSNI